MGIDFDGDLLMFEVVDVLINGVFSGVLLVFSYMLNFDYLGFDQLCFCVMDGWIYLLIVVVNIVVMDVNDQLVV